MPRHASFPSTEHRKRSVSWVIGPPISAFARGTVNPAIRKAVSSPTWPCPEAPGARKTAEKNPRGNLPARAARHVPAEVKSAGKFRWSVRVIRIS